MSLGCEWRYYVCFKHKTHSKTHSRDCGRIPKCPICGNDMKFIGINASFPKKKNENAWKELYEQYLDYISRDKRWAFLRKKIDNSENSKMWNGSAI